MKTHCPETGRACELDCGLGRVCVRIRAVPRCGHGRHPAECGQCLSGSSAFDNTLKFARGVIADRIPNNVYRVRLNDRGEIAEMMNITDDGK